MAQKVQLPSDFVMPTSTKASKYPWAEWLKDSHISGGSGLVLDASDRKGMEPNAFLARLRIQALLRDLVVSWSNKGFQGLTLDKGSYLITCRDMTEAEKVENKTWRATRKAKFGKSNGLRKAKAALAAKKFDAAIKACKKILKDLPEDADTVKVLAEAKDAKAASGNGAQTEAPTTNPAPVATQPTAGVTSTGAQTEKPKHRR